jgi:hypothetical protein
MLDSAPLIDFIQPQGVQETRLSRLGYSPETEQLLEEIWQLQRKLAFVVRSAPAMPPPSSKSVELAPLLMDAELGIFPCD